MKPQAVIAGLPQGLAIRHKGYRPNLEGWEVHIVPSRKRGADLDSCWNEVMRVADPCIHEGAHILAFQIPADVRPSLSARRYGRHRLMWLEREHEEIYGTDEFTQRVRELLEFETIWRANVRPTRVADALVLPENVFEAGRHVAAMWRRADAVRAGHDDVQSVKRLIDNFAGEHWRHGNWVDARERIFEHHGARHGKARDGDRWKYTFSVPDDFHYDVRAVGEGKFFLTDRSGNSAEYRRYTNVDCQGAVARGE